MLSADGIVEEFLERWRRSELARVMPEPQVIASSDGRNGAHWIELTSLAVYDKYQGNGYATRALQMLTALCDENGIPVKLSR